MGVYIKGMEMPTRCAECWLMDGEDSWCTACRGRHLYPEYRYGIKDRPDWCPLVPVPDHGRLIDENWLKNAMITTLEALKNNPKMDGQEMHLIAAFDTLRVMIEDCPTIIQADQAEEEKE